MFNKIQYKIKYARLARVLRTTEWKDINHLVRADRQVLLNKSKRET